MEYGGIYVLSQGNGRMVIDFDLIIRHEQVQTWIDSSRPKHTLFYLKGTRKKLSNL